MDDFVAVDFETANRARNSACAVGDEVLDLYKRSGKTTGKLAKAVELQEGHTDPDHQRVGVS